MRLAVLLLILMLSPAPGHMPVVTRTVHVMGTNCTLSVVGKNRNLLIEQLEVMVRMIEDAERELSTWQETSTLSALNTQSIGVPLAADSSMCRLFKELFYWVDETGGAFEPAIGALTEAYGIRTGGRHPSNAELERARIQSGMYGYKMDATTCQITRISDVKIDCGAFGKGEALERLRLVRNGEGIDSWLVNLGGQVAVYGKPSAAEGWTLDIAHPKFRSKPAFQIHLTSGSLATSGGSERDLQILGQRQSHIVDPRSGLPAAFDGSVSVWHESALVADILSTALFVMGPDEGMEWAEKRNMAVCYLFGFGSDIRANASRAFRNRFGDPLLPGSGLLNSDQAPPKANPDSEPSWGVPPLWISGRDKNEPEH